VIALLLCGEVLAAPMGPRSVDALPSIPPTVVQKYGEDKLQYGELRVPEGVGPFPVAIIIHGGCWTKGYATLRNTSPIASALTKAGFATWNIEYRQVGDKGGGWPGTFLDWGAGADHLRELAKIYPLNLARIVAVGHSAGAHAALWLAARNRLPAESEIRGAVPLSIQAAFAIDGPGDLAGFVGVDADICGKSVVVPLMDGTPLEKPERYRQASPWSLQPLGVPQFLVSATVLTREQAQSYQKRGQELGDTVEVLVPAGAGHFDVIAPGQAAWDAVQALILKQALGSR
jgi:acetyl esterase/lipase